MNRKKWIFVWVAMIALQFLPMFTTKNYHYDISGNFVLAGNIISNNLLQYLDRIYVIFKVIPIAFLILLACKKKVTKLYLVYIAAMYLIFAVVQNVGFVEGYGLGVVVPNIIMCIIMSTMWFFEARNCEMEYVFRSKEPLYYLLIPFCILAFWDPPVNHAIEGISMQFTLHNLIFSFAGLAECMMTCIFITVYIFTHDSYDSNAFKLLCMVGIFRGIENVALVFVYINSDRGAALAWLITHIPLVVTSFTGYILTIQSAGDIKGRKSEEF